MAAAELSKAEVSKISALHAVEREAFLEKLRDLERVSAAQEKVSAAQKAEMEKVSAAQKAELESKLQAQESKLQAQEEVNKERLLRRGFLGYMFGL